MNCNGKQETIPENEEKYVLWEFTATFDHLLHTELVRIVNDHSEVSTVTLMLYSKEMLS